MWVFIGSPHLAVRLPVAAVIGGPLSIVNLSKVGVIMIVVLQEEDTPGPRGGTPHKGSVVLARGEGT